MGGGGLVRASLVVALFDESGLGSCAGADTAIRKVLDCDSVDGGGGGGDDGGAGGGAVEGGFLLAEAQCGGGGGGDDGNGSSPRMLDPSPCPRWLLAASVSTLTLPLFPGRRPMLTHASEQTRGVSRQHFREKTKNARY